jgi:PAS domain S-box-containing protein
MLFLFLWPATILCAWYGGFGPGLFATLLSAVAGWLLVLEPDSSVSHPAEGLGVALFVLLGLLISTLAERLHHAKRLIEQHACELDNQRELLRVTLVSIADAVLATDAQGRLTFLNPAAQCLTGWTEDEARGQSVERIFQAVHEQTGLPIENAAARVLQTGVAVHQEGRTALIARSGAATPVEASAAPIRSEHGEVLGAVLVFQDVTVQRQAEAELRGKADGLVAADRRKDDFLAMLAHEFRNPLAAVRNAAELLRRPNSDPASLSWAGDLIIRQVGHVLRLVNDILDATRIRRGKLQLHAQLVQMGQVVNDAVESSRPLVDARRHQLTVSVPSFPVWLVGDSGRLTQAVGNLLSNAAKYTEESGHIHLSLEATAHEVVLRVQDDGIGIAPEMLSTVFDPFAQSERALSLSQGGLGIGLGLVRSLVEMHGGRVEAHSDGPGCGSKFVIHLPTDGAGRNAKDGADLRPVQCTELVL